MMPSWYDTEKYRLCRFLLTQQLPENMLQLRKSIENDGSDVNGQDDAIGSCDNLSEEREEENGEDAEMTQIELGNLRVSNLCMFEQIAQ